MLKTLFLFGAAIDFTSYPVGVYFVKLYCDKIISQYQIVRGE